MTQVVLTATILWVTNKTPTPCNFEPGYQHACYVVPNDTIYISKEIRGVNKYFALYHEIGHALYKENFSRDIFKAWWGDTEQEVMANAFGWWMYGKKFPRERRFTERVVNKARRDFFISTVPQKEIQKILRLKVK